MEAQTGPKLNLTARTSLQSKRKVRINKISNQGINILSLLLALKLNVSDKVYYLLKIIK